MIKYKNNKTNEEVAVLTPIGIGMGRFVGTTFVVYREIDNERLFIMCNAEFNKKFTKK